MSGQLAEAVRTVIATLRSLANTLESALARAEATASPTPVVDLESAHSWELPASIAPEPAAAPFLTPRHGSVPAIAMPEPLTPPTAITRLLIHCLLCLATAWIGAFGLVGLKWRSLRGLHVLGLLAAGLVLHLTAGSQNLDLLRNYLSEPPCTSSSRHLGLPDQSGLELLPSISGCSPLSKRALQTPTPSPIHSRHWQKERSTAPHLALIFLSNNGDPEDSREGLPHAVCHAPSCRGPTSSRGSRSVCGASHGERRRSASGVASGFHSGGVDSARDGGCRGFPFWAFNRDLGAGNGGGRCRTRGSLRDKHQLPVDGFQLGGSSDFENSTL